MATSLASTTRPEWPGTTSKSSVSAALTEASTGLDPEPRGDRVDPARQLLRVERDTWLDIDPADRRAGVGDGPVDGGAVATDGQRLVDQCLGIEAAADLGVGDDRRAVRTDEDDLPLGRRAICGSERGLRLIGGLPRQVDATDRARPGRTRPMYCWS